MMKDEDLKDEDFLEQGLDSFYGMYEFFYEKTDNISVALKLLQIWWYGLNQGGKK